MGRMDFGTLRQALDYADMAYDAVGFKPAIIDNVSGIVVSYHFNASRRASL